MKKFFSSLSILLFTLCLLASAETFGQPGGGPGPCTIPPCNPPNPPGLVPIDGGILLLLTSGLVYGVNKLRKNP